MRTKQFLTALCIPMAFAACSNEDFINEMPSLESRGTVNVSLNASKPIVFDSETRMDIDGNNNFLWEKDVDMIGAAMADGAAYETIKNEVFVNYPFTAQSSGVASAFNAKSSISKGHYLFYYGYKDVLERGKLDLSVPEQIYKVDSVKNAKQQAAGQMKMIAPIVNLDKGVGYVDAQGYNLNLEFVNLYTMVKVVVESSNIPEGKTPTLQKITLNAAYDENTSQTKGFVRKAYANLVNIAGTDKANVLAPEGTNKQLKPEKMKKAKEALENLLAGAGNQTATIDAITVGDKISDIYDQTGITEGQYGPATLKVIGNLALSSEKATELYILAPKGTYNKGLVLTVETSEGTYTKAVAKPTNGNLTLGNQIQKINAKLDFKMDGTGNVILPTKFEINNSADWTNAVDFLTEHAVAYINKKDVTFELKKDVEVPNLPVFDLTITGGKILTLTKDYTINEQNKEMFKANTVTLGVKAGATLTLDVEIGADGFGGIRNNGTLNVNATQTKKITNLGTMNVKKNVTLSGGLDNGKKEVKGANPSPAISGTVEVAAGKTLTISATLGLNNLVGNININKSGDEIGKLVIDFASSNEGTIKNQGEISGNAVITNAGTIDNFGTLKPTQAITNTDGEVIVEKNGVGACTISGGKVEVKDVTEFKKTQSDNGKKYTLTNAVVTTLVNNAKEYGDAEDATAGITNITLNGGTWTLKAAKGNGDTKEIAKPANKQGLTLKNATLKLEESLAESNIIVEGASSISAATAQSITKANLTVKAAGTLTVENHITVNGAASGDYTGYAATILGKLNVEAGAKMYFATASVGSEEVSGAEINVKGNTAENLNPGVFGVNDTNDFLNYGDVRSLKGSAAGNAAKDGVVSRPFNKTTNANISGNTTENTEIFS